MSAKLNDLTLLGNALRKHGGPLTDLVRKLDANPEIWDDALGRFLRGENPWQKLLSKSKRRTRIWHFIGRVELPSYESFLPRAHFLKTPEVARETSRVLINDIHPDLRDRIYVCNRQTNPATWTLRIRRIDREVLIQDIWEKIGPHVPFARFWQLLERQGRGEEGALAVDGNYNWFLLDSQTAYSCCWLGGWWLGIGFLSRPLRLCEGTRLFTA